MSHTKSFVSLTTQVINGGGYNEKTDIWSLGCTVIEMLTTKPPWGDLEPMSALFRIGTHKMGPDLPPNISVPLQRFLEYTFIREISQRPSAESLLQTEFVKSGTY